jgi:hypothetical protein
MGDDPPRAARYSDRLHLTDAIFDMHGLNRLKQTPRNLAREPDLSNL